MITLGCYYVTEDYTANTISHPKIRSWWKCNCRYVRSNISFSTIAWHTLRSFPIAEKKKLKRLALTILVESSLVSAEQKEKRENGGKKVSARDVIIDRRSFSRVPKLCVLVGDAREGRSKVVYIHVEFAVAKKSAAAFYFFVCEFMRVEGRLEISFAARFPCNEVCVYSI